MPVPSDVEPTCLHDLVADCHALNRALAAGRTAAATTTATAPALAPTGGLDLLARLPLARLPLSFGLLPAEITEGLLVSVTGYEAYSS